MIHSTRICGGRTADRRARVDAIRDAAIVRAVLGQVPMHSRLADGRHQVARFDRAENVLRVYTADTLPAAIDQARGQHA